MLVSLIFKCKRRDIPGVSTDGEHIIMGKGLDDNPEDGD
jgi:hypothetical protein